MALDLETLLAPVSEESPAGEDLAYDPDRTEIEQAFERSVSVDITGAAETESDVDWRRIISLIEQQCAKTKDIWLAVYLCRAGARSGDLPVLEVGAEFLAGLCERFWDTMHPSLEDYGFQGRKGPCESLANVGAFLGPLRRVVLLRHARLGAFTGADFERFRTGGENEDGYGMFRAVLAETPDADIVGIGIKLDTIAAAIKRAEGILDANAEGDTGANFAATYDAIAQIRRAVLSFAAAPPTDEDAGAGDAAVGASASADGGGPRIAGRVESREDVIKALDAIADYYRRKEPVSPVPLALLRARSWVDADFMSVLADIAPDSLSDLRRVLQARPKEDE